MIFNRISDEVVSYLEIINLISIVLWIAFQPWTTGKVTFRALRVLKYEELDGDNPPVKDELFDNLTPSGFASLFRHILRDNPHAAEPQKGWKEMWEKDFRKLRETLSVPDVLDIIVVSQIPKNQPYYVRPLKLVEKLDLLKTMVQERRKALPALRVEFKKTVKQLEKQYDW